MTMEEMKARMIEEIKKEMEETGYINDSDGTESIFYSLPKQLISEDTENYESLRDELNYFSIGYVQENYKKVARLYDNGDCTLYYYDNKHKFEEIEDLEKYFEFGE